MPPNLWPIKPSALEMQDEYETWDHVYPLLLGEWTDACCSSDILAAGTALYALGAPALSMRRFHGELSLEF